MSARQTQPSTPRKRRQPGILIADDDPGILHLLRAALQSHGFAAWLAKDGQEAIDLFQIHKDSIDMVLLDVKMPRLNGPQVLAEIKRIQPKVACCFLSGVVDRKAGLELLNEGALGFFPKPFNSGKVAEMVWQLVEGSEPAEVR
jgi:DNA-binding NtrC family response regulator